MSSSLDFLLLFNSLTCSKLILFNILFNVIILSSPYFSIILKIIIYNIFLFSNWYFKYFSFKAIFISLFIPIYKSWSIHLHTCWVNTTLYLCSFIKSKTFSKKWLGARSRIKIKFFYLHKRLIFCIYYFTVL